MTISQLIAALEVARANHGDIEVQCSDQNQYSENGPVTTAMLAHKLDPQEPDYILLEP